MMAPSSRAAGQFFGTDLDVYHFVTRLLRANPDQQPNFFSVYDHIQRSNLPLRRKPKSILEKSIERVLAVCCPVEVVPLPILEDPSPKDVSADPNIMNRIIVQTRAAAAKAQADSALPDSSDSSQKRTRPRNSIDTTRKKIKASAPSGADVQPSGLQGVLPLEELKGMAEVKRNFAKYVALPLKANSLYFSQGISLPTGILLHGPPGCGKTAFCKAFAAAMQVPLFEISGPSVVSNMSGESEKMIREIFDEAKRCAPSIIFIDEIDSIAVKRESSQTQMDKRIVAQLLLSIDSIDPTQNEGKAVVVLAATNLPESLDPALRRGGRFGMEIAFPAPDENSRMRILRSLSRKLNLSPDVDFATLGRLTAGYVGADLSELVKRVSLSVVERHMGQVEKCVGDEMMDDDKADVNLENEDDEADRLLYGIANISPQTIPHVPAIGMTDFTDVISTLQPSLKREGFTNVPTVTWAEVSYPGQLKNQMIMTVVNRIKFPDRYRQLGLSTSSGVLLWGPPGCGKTLLAKVVANDANASLISINASELLNKYVGESEAAVRRVFSRARAAAPCIVFFDEIDALVSRRNDLSDSTSRVVNTILAEMDGMASRDGVQIIATTNRPDILDPAVLRPGRLQTMIYIDLPDYPQRANILRILLSGANLSEEFITNLARDCEGMSGADLGYLVERAKIMALDEGCGLGVGMEEKIEEAKRRTVPSVRNMKVYRDLQKKLSKGQNVLSGVSPGMAKENLGEDGGGVESVQPGHVLPGCVMADTAMAEN